MYKFSCWFCKNFVLFCNNFLVSFVRILCCFEIIFSLILYRFPSFFSRNNFWPVCKCFLAGFCNDFLVGLVMIVWLVFVMIFWLVLYRFSDWFCNDCLPFAQKISFYRSICFYCYSDDICNYVYCSLNRATGDWLLHLFVVKDMRNNCFQ